MISFEEWERYWADDPGPVRFVTSITKVDREARFMPFRLPSRVHVALLEELREQYPDSPWQGLTADEVTQVAAVTSDDAVSYALAMAGMIAPKLDKGALEWVGTTAQTFHDAGV